MFVKYNKQDNTRWLFLNGSLVVESNGKNVAIGKTNQNYSNAKSVAFDYAISNVKMAEKVKRFVRKALSSEGDKRRLNFSVTICEDSRVFTANVSFSETKS